MPKAARFVVAAIVTAALVAQTENGADARKRRRPALHDCGDPFTGSAPDGFTVALSTDKSRYARGESVTFTFRVTNGTGQPYTHWVGLPDAVFAVFSGDKLIWSSSYAKAYPALALEETFEAGEQKTATSTWGQDLCRIDADGGTPDPAFVPGPPRAGTYTAQAAWRGVWASHMVTFTIGR